MNQQKKIDELSFLRIGRCVARIRWILRDKAVLRIFPSNRAKGLSTFTFWQTAFERFTGKKRILNEHQKSIKRESNEHQITFDTKAKGCSLIYIRFSPIGETLQLEAGALRNSWLRVLLFQFYFFSETERVARAFSAICGRFWRCCRQGVGQPIARWCLALSNGIRSYATVCNGIQRFRSSHQVPIKIWNSLLITICN